jgi:hypothetical protein
MSKRKTVIELQSKPENKAVRQIVQKTKPVEFAPINQQISKTQSDDTPDESEVKPITKKLQSNNQKPKNSQAQNQSLKSESSNSRSIGKDSSRKKEIENVETKPMKSNPGATSKTERLRIFQTSTPITRTLTKFQKAAIVVHGENGKQLIELLWRDQMNEKTRDIWDFLCKRFEQTGEEMKTNEVSIRKRDILEGSGVKSDRTFISAIYTLEDMGLIEVKRLSGNKEGNIYNLTEEGREEINIYQNSGV